METPPVMDLAAALDRFDGDQDLFLTLAGLFVERSGQALDDLQQALSAQDLPVLVKEAHKLKGAAMEFCARPAVAAATHLEEAARKAAVQEIPALAEQTRAAVERLTAALVEIMQKGFPS
ncbi:MAG: Hpt domain-containing protein [Nitrospira sp.]